MPTHDHDSNRPACARPVLRQDQSWMIAVRRSVRIAISIAVRAAWIGVGAMIDHSQSDWGLVLLALASAGLETIQERKDVKKDSSLVDKTEDSE